MVIRYKKNYSNTNIYNTIDSIWCFSFNFTHIAKTIVLIDHKDRYLDLIGPRLNQTKNNIFESRLEGIQCIESNYIDKPTIFILELDHAEHYCVHIMHYSAHRRNNILDLNTKLCNSYCSNAV